MKYIQVFVIVVAFIMYSSNRLYFIMKYIQVFVVVVAFIINLKIILSSRVTLTKENKLVMTISAEEILLQMDKFIVQCEGHHIITIEIM
jgi:hypothetical protein